MTEKKKARAGDQVTIDYSGKIKGTEEVILSSTQAGPFIFKINDDTTFKKINDAVLGMKLNEIKNVELSPDEAFGEIDQELIVELPRTNVPDNAEVGTVLQNKEDEDEEWLITSVTDDTVTLDGNHPLAGQTLSFEIVLVALESL